MREKVLKEVAAKLKKIREQMGCDQKQMAARLGVTLSAYYKNEYGQYLPSLSSLSRLVEDYKISVDWLFFNKGSMYYEEKGKKERELEETVKKLTSELEQERRNLAEKSRAWDQERQLQQEKNAFIETRPELKELLEDMERNPIFYHELMIYFQKYKQANKEGRK